MDSIQKFFSEYAVASLPGKASTVARFYAKNFMAASKNGSVAFTNDQKFIEWLNGVFEFNKRVGLQKMEVKNVESISIGKYFVKATVTWVLIFAKKPEEEIVFDLHYILNRVEEGFEIVLYISDEDQEELMKTKGLL